LPLQLFFAHNLLPKIVGNGREGDAGSDFTPLPKIEKMNIFSCQKLKHISIWCQKLKKMFIFSIFGKGKGTEIRKSPLLTSKA
jgi:hypothetical protein